MDNVVIEIYDGASMNTITSSTPEFISDENVKKIEHILRDKKK